MLMVLLVIVALIGSITGSYEPEKKVVVEEEESYWYMGPHVDPTDYPDYPDNTQDSGVSCWSNQK